KLVSALARGIHRGIEDAEFSLDVEGAGRAGKIGISDEPGAGMAGHVKLGNDADSTVASIGNDFARLLLGIEESVGAEFGELGKSLALDAKALVFAEMPMEDVEFD